MRIILKFIKTYKKNNDLSDKFLKEALIERFNISIQKFSKEKLSLVSINPSYF